MTIPSQVKIVEVSPRDGLQNETAPVPAEVKIDFINRLSRTGLKHIEVTSFVLPRSIPQLADARKVFTGINKDPTINYTALVPNEKGLERAVKAGVTEIAVFTAASDTFNKKNINVDIEGSFERFAPVAAAAKEKNIKIRGYVSCVLGCPYEGSIDATKVAKVSKRLFDMGCYEISLGDTIGSGTALQAQRMLAAVAADIPLEQLAIHFHDTRGQALANILACLQLGVATIDSAAAGLGGCPYADGASGNVATEDLLYMLDGMGIETGVDMNKVIDAGQFISQAMGRQPTSRLSRLPKWKRVIV